MMKPKLRMFLEANGMKGDASEQEEGGFSGESLGPLHNTFFSFPFGDAGPDFPAEFFGWSLG